MLVYCPLKDCECKYRYCPCFTGNIEEHQFGCMVVDIIKGVAMEQKSRMSIQELAKLMTANTGGVSGYFSSIIPKEECK